MFKLETVLHALLLVLMVGLHCVFMGLLVVSLINEML